MTFRRTEYIFRISGSAASPNDVDFTCRYVIEPTEVGTPNHGVANTSFYKSHLNQIINGLYSQLYDDQQSTLTTVVTDEEVSVQQHASSSSVPDFFDT